MYYHKTNVARSEEETLTGGPRNGGVYAFFRGREKQMKEDEKRMTDMNHAVLTGVMVGAPQYVGERYGERMYDGWVKVRRLSGTYDMLPVHMGEYTLARRLDALEAGTPVRLEGELRNYKQQDNPFQRKRLGVFVRKMLILAEKSQENAMDENEVQLEGVVMRAPVYRVTPLGREICDLAIRVERGHEKYTSVSLIAWGKMAEWARLLEVGERVLAEGRMQSRRYDKHDHDGTVYNLTVHEVSLTKLRLWKGETA